MCKWYARVRKDPVSRPIAEAPSCEDYWPRTWAKGWEPPKRFCRHEDMKRRWLPLTVLVGVLIVAGAIAAVAVASRASPYAEFVAQDHFPFYPRDVTPTVFFTIAPAT